MEATHFQLYKRARHVFEEAFRVLQFRKIALEAESHADDTHTRLGALLDASHASCRDMFECSHEQLDELTSLAKKAGAWGSRLTGAGWGGCTVSLVTEADVPAFIEAISKEYGPYKGLDKAALEQVIFATKPGSGAGGECPWVFKDSLLRTECPLVMLFSVFDSFQVGPLKRLSSEFALESRSHL